MKNSINITNNVDLMFNTYRCLFFKLLLRIFDVVGQLRPCKQDESARQCGGNGKALESTSFEIHKTIMAQKCWKMLGNISDCVKKNISLFYSFVSFSLNIHVNNNIVYFIAAYLNLNMEI